MAKFRHISTKLVLVLDAGQVDGKKVTKRVTISNIREDASTDALWELAEALGKLLAYPVAEVRLYKVEELVREAGDGTADENGDVHKEADTGMAWAGGGEALPAVARAFGGSDKNEQPSGSFNDGYLQEPRLPVFSIGNGRALRASPRAVTGGAAIRDQTRQECTRPPPECEKSKLKTGFI